jgi:hypothetical protein
VYKQLKHGTSQGPVTRSGWANICHSPKSLQAEGKRSRFRLCATFPQSDAVETESLSGFPRDQGGLRPQTWKDKFYQPQNVGRSRDRARNLVILTYSSYRCRVWAFIYASIAHCGLVLAMRRVIHLRCHGPTFALLVPNLTCRISSQLPLLSCPRQLLHPHLHHASKSFSTMP